VTDAELEAAFPELPWRQPVELVVPERSSRGLGCRLCIAHYGIQASDIDRTMQTEEDFAAHMATFHATAP
jgi:hypothetical protein